MFSIFFHIAVVKDTILKAIHNYKTIDTSHNRVVKDTILKAIHNARLL